MLKYVLFIFLIFTFICSTTSLWCRCRGIAIPINNTSMQTATHACCDELGYPKTKKFWTNHCDIGSDKSKESLLNQCCLRRAKLAKQSWTYDCS